jgi:hypothetical protein
VALSNVWKVCALMSRTANPRYYSIPLAMVMLAGFVHAGFEDWLFAVGSYLSLFFWVCTFQLADLVPEVDPAVTVSPSLRIPHSLPADYGAVVSNPVVSNR